MPDSSGQGHNAGQSILTSGDLRDCLGHKASYQAISGGEAAGAPRMLRWFR